MSKLRKVKGVGKMALKIIVTEGSGESNPIPEGLYSATVKNIEEKTGKNGDYLKISFEIREGTYKGVIRNTLASQRLSKLQDGKNSKLFDIVKAVMKVEPEMGLEFDLTDLIGRNCQILVVNGKITNGTQYQEISKVLPE